MEPDGPLSGVNVVELTTYAAGPSAGAILADWGAEVLKVESLDGDPFRFFQSSGNPGGEEHSTSQLDNRGKRSLALNLRESSGRRIMGELLDGADVFLTNLRLKALENLGLDYGSLSASHPQLVYALLTGYGIEGAETHRAAFDAGTWWGRAGVAMALLPEDAEPTFHAGAIGDHTTGLTLTGGICAALFSRERTGRGQQVHVCMLRTGAYFISSSLYATLCGEPRSQKRKRSEIPNMLVAPYRTKDGKWIYLLGMDGDAAWSKLARALERPEWIDDARFNSTAARAEHGAAVVEMLDAIFVTRTRDEWGESLDRHLMWWAPVQTVDELPGDPQMRAAGCFAKVDTRWGEREMVPGPVDFSATPWRIRSGSPALGEHADEVLRSLGRNAEEIAQLRAAGIIR